MPGKGEMRGKSWGAPGLWHDVSTHNAFEHDHQDSYEVTQEDALKFKNWMTTDAWDFNRVRPYYPTVFDKNLNFLNDRVYFLYLFLFGYAIWYLNGKFD
jgi:hypothetical protein